MSATISRCVRSATAATSRQHEIIIIMEDAFTDQDEKSIDKSAHIAPVGVRFTDTYRVFLRIEGDNDDDIEEEKNHDRKQEVPVPPQHANTKNPHAAPPMATFLTTQLTDHTSTIESSEEDIDLFGAKKYIV